MSETRAYVPTAPNDLTWDIGPGDYTMSAGTVAAQDVTGSLQDLMDGAALRRLREALPDMTLTAEYVAEWHLTVSLHGQPLWQGYGATIAEAADKCREALTGLHSGR
jgi:hypothetical protein